MVSGVSTLRKISAEFLGTALLLLTIIGSGIMATNITTDGGVRLMINVFCIISILAVLITIFGPISGSHFNPVVTVVELWRRQLSPMVAGYYIAAQMTGAIVGTITANFMFNKPLVFASHHDRSGMSKYLGEIVATAGLIMVIALLRKNQTLRFAPVVVSAWIGAACFFTSSTSFVNPAVTVARSLSDTYAGIAPHSILPFIAAQLVGAAIGIGVSSFFNAR
jgi:glycerol uptake facilitator-like aquaporin